MATILAAFQEALTGAKKSGSAADRAEAEALLAHLKKFRMPKPAAGPRYAATRKTDAKKGTAK